MTPEKNAIELISKFINLGFTIDSSKQCALIAVCFAIEYNDFHIDFLQEVKTEIEKL